MIEEMAFSFSDKDSDRASSGGETRWGFSDDWATCVAQQRLLSFGSSLGPSVLVPDFFQALGWRTCTQMVPSFSVQGREQNAHTHATTTKPASTTRGNRLIKMQT